MSDEAKVYHDIFESWADVRGEFQTEHAEPSRVLYAGYRDENYEGEADVAWLNDDGSIGYVEGSHCSCYGLEGQFVPETYSADIARQMLARDGWTFGKAREAIAAALDG